MKRRKRREIKTINKPEKKWKKDKRREEEEEEKTLKWQQQQQQQIEWNMQNNQFLDICLFIYLFVYVRSCVLCILYESDVMGQLQCLPLQYYYNIRFVLLSMLFLLLLFWFLFLFFWMALTVCVSSFLSHSLC